MDLDAAAQRVGQTSERLAEWENGARAPTLNQLRLLAGVYKRSVGVFFLKEPPRVPKRPLDYRRLELSARESMEPTLANGIREAEAKRDGALDIFAELEEAPPVWNLTIAAETPPEEAAAIVTARLGVTMRDRAGWRTHFDALNGWRTAVESLGVLVVQLSGVSIQEMRGCSLAHFPLPVIVLNGADSPLGRVFTLLHELTHLARGESSLCDFVEDAPRAGPDEVVEAYCNHVAGAVLVPLRDLMARPEVVAATAQTEWTADQLGLLRRAFWSSSEVVLRRLLMFNKTSRAHYRAMRDRFQREYANLRAQDNGPVIVPYYRRVLLSNGRFLTRLAVSAYSAQAITGTELSRILNAKLDHLPRIREALAGEVVA
jgi:Zn-dependent peptidase ImmA (M78 family)